jgi:ribA/ribD-fused uncharacterized protein
VITQFNGNNRWLSNFTACSVQLDGVTYRSTEAAYQAAKTIVDTERLQFQSMPPGKAKRAGKTVTMRADWNVIKLSVMEDLTRQKYSTELMKFRLLNTGDVEIQEGNSWGDTFWGICGGVGQNNLGKIIMKIRQELLEGQC